MLYSCVGTAAAASFPRSRHLPTSTSGSSTPPSCCGRRSTLATTTRRGFAELRAEEAIRATVEQLCAGHVQLDAALRPPPGDEPEWTPVLAALEQLRHHIDKEEYGVFPAAVVLLPIPAWERITQAAKEPP